MYVSIVTLSLSLSHTQGKWYDWYTYEALESPGEFVELDAPWNVIPLHIRAGSILALHGQSPNGTRFLTTADARRAPFRLVVAMDEAQSAEGRLYLDDGVSLDVEGATSHILFAASPGSLQMMSGSFGFPTTVRIEHITLLGVDEDIAFVTVNGQEVEVEPSSAGGVVEIDVSLPMEESFTLTWSPRSSSDGDSSGLSNGAVAGIVVGSVVGVAAMAGGVRSMSRFGRTAENKDPLIR